MSAYILRYARSEHFAGLYAAENDAHLFYLVSEEGDATQYEYALLPRGFGVEFYEGKRGINYALGKGCPERVLALSRTNGIYMTEGLRVALDSGEGLIWRRF